MNVTFSTSDGSTLTVLLDDTTPILSDGAVQWDTVARPKRTAITRFSGRNPYKQDISVMFDGWSDHASQESDISTLVRMASLSHTVTLSGQALRKDLTWIFNGVDWDNQKTIWITQGKSQVRVRQAAVVHLLEYIPDTILNTPAAPRTETKNKKPAKKITTPKGMTLKQLAQIEFGNPDKWHIIQRDNPWLVNDPRILVPAGTVITVINGKIPVFRVP